jgi:hypothetical protein
MFLHIEAWQRVSDGMDGMDQSLGPSLPQYNSTAFFSLGLCKGPGIQYECW